MTHEDIIKSYPNIHYVQSVINSIESYSDEYKLHDSVLSNLEMGIVSNEKTLKEAMIFMSASDRNQKTKYDTLKKAYQNYRKEIDSFINIIDYEGPNFNEFNYLQKQIHRWDIFYDCN